MNSDASEFAAQSLALTGVQSSPHLDAKSGRVSNHRFCASNRAGRSVECSQESIARRVDLAPTIVSQLATHLSLMTLQQVSPIAISKACEEFSGGDDVGAEDRDQDAVFNGVAAAGGELIN